MRSSTLLSAALAGCALASPLMKRDEVIEIDTVYDVVYVTQYVTETAGAAPVVTSTVVPSVVESTSSEVPSTTSSVEQKKYYNNRYSWSWAWTTKVAASTTQAPASTEAASSVVVSTVASSSEPEATSSVPVLETSSAVYEASSTSVYSAPAYTSSAAEVSDSDSNFNLLEARAGTPTCNPNNVRIFTNTFPSPTAYCRRWQAAAPNPTNKIADGLTKKQTNNICSCVLAGSYVSGVPLTKTSAAAQATTYQQRVVVHHNVHRANHSAPDLAWDQGLADTAKKIANSCVYAHDTATDGGGYGQNIAAGVAPANISAVITDLFYNGEVGYYDNLYGQANPDMSNFHAWGHFSQIVWKATTKVGCATVDCSASGLANTGGYVSPFFTVCNYKSPGNYGGEYATNIGKSLNRATVGWNYGL